MIARKYVRGRPLGLRSSRTSFPGRRVARAMSPSGASTENAFSSWALRFGLPHRRVSVTRALPCGRSRIGKTSTGSSCRRSRAVIVRAAPPLQMFGCLRSRPSTQAIHADHGRAGGDRALDRIRVIAVPCASRIGSVEVTRLAPASAGCAVSTGVSIRASSGPSRSAGGVTPRGTTMRARRSPAPGSRATGTRLPR